MVALQLRAVSGQESAAGWSLFGLGGDAGSDEDAFAKTVETKMAEVPKSGSGLEWCPGPITTDVSLLKDVVSQKYTNGEKCLAWWNQKTASAEQLEKAQATLEPFSHGGSLLQRGGAGWGGWGRPGAGQLRWSQGGAEAVAKAMYSANFIPGQSDQGPQSARGIWWMKGNAMPEELYSTLHGTWVEEHNALVVPDSPFTWAWPSACFTNMPLAGAICTPERIIKYSNDHVLVPQTISFQFSECPAQKDAYYCDDSLGNLSYALMQFHKPIGDLTQAATGMTLAGLPLTSTFTLEAPKEGAGSRYLRACYWGLGGCNAVPMGSYDLVKLIDYDGKPVEPYFSEWVKYAGDVPMFTWSGWGSASDRAAAARGYSRAC